MQAAHRVLAGVVGRDLDAELVVDLRVAVRREGHGHDHGIVEPSGGGQGRAEQADGGEVGRAGADQGQQDDRPGVGQLLELALGERVRHRDERPAGVPLPRLPGLQVEAAEGPELGVGERLDVPTRARR